MAIEFTLNYVYIVCIYVIFVVDSDSEVIFTIFTGTKPLKRRFKFFSKKTFDYTQKNNLPMRSHIGE